MEGNEAVRPKHVNERVKNFTQASLPIESVIPSGLYVLPAKQIFQ